MREIYKEGTPPKSVRFLYKSKIGAPLLRLLTCRFVSRLAGKYLDSRVSRRKIKGYVKRHSINIAEYEQKDYRSFNEFFTRKILPECRPFDETPQAFVSPCDCKLTVFPIAEKSEFTVKGFRYTVGSLLKNDELAEKYRGGVAIICRLSVCDYHRYHYLDDGEKGENVFIKGRYHTVQPVALERRRVFAENSREYTVLHTAHFGDVTQVEVGAMMVGRIVNNHGAHRFSRGEEKGRFEFGGSTIVLLVEKDKVVFDEELYTNTENGFETAVKCGERIGTAI